MLSKRKCKQLKIKGRAKSLTLIISLAITILASAALLGADLSHAKITTANTPVGAGNAHLKWERQFGTGYANAVTPPLIIGDNIYIGSGGVMYELDRKTGNIKRQCKLNGVFGYTTIAPSHNGTSPDGKDATEIYVPISGGRIGAVNIAGEKMAPAQGWSDGASESFGGQAISPVVYHDGCLYTGAYGSKTDDQYFVEIDASNGKIKSKLATNSSGGFYWSGAYVTDKFAVFGEEAADGKSTVRSVAVSGNDVPAGTLISSRSVSGSVRGSMVARTEGGITYLYFVTQGKALCKVPVTSDGKLGEVKSVPLSGQSVGVPQITDKRAYVGTGAAKVDVIDTGSMTQKYHVSVQGYPQGELLIRKKDAASDYIYGTYNKKPGGMFFVQAGESGAVSSGNLYTPEHPEYCISPVECDEEGTLYFKNDSGYIMAVTSGYDLRALALKKISVNADATKLSWNVRENVSGYEIYRAVKKNGRYSRIGTVKTTVFKDTKTLPGTTYYYKVRGRIGDQMTKDSNIVSARSALAKPKIKTRAGKRKITVTWKKIKGATGYKIYQATKKKGKYKIVKTIKRQKTTKYVKKKLRKGKKYFYKVKALRMIGGKTAYSRFSNISYKKAR